METRPPTPLRILVAVGFALSCFGILLFLWIAFGGPTPLGPKGYRVHVPFQEATQLAVESDVRISGVSVGKVKSIELSDDGYADAELELESRYAPMPSDTKAILRQKTLLGETYVELTPGNDESEPLPEGGSLAPAQVSDAVQLDEVFRTFDDQTRADFQVWMADAAVALNGRGADLNAAIGNLSPFVARADDLITVLDGQRNAVEQLVRDGGETFDAISERPGQLRSLILNAERVFTTIADRDEELKDAFRVLPTFLDESRLTLERLDSFAAEADPLITQLRPAIRELSGTLIALRDVSPLLESFFVGLQRASELAPEGFVALRDILEDALPAPLARLDSFVAELLPTVEVLRRYRGEITAFLANVAAASNGFTTPPEAGTRPIKYLRTSSPLGPEVLASFMQRLSTSRTNAYVKQRGYENLTRGLDSFLTAQCSGGLDFTIDPTDAGAFPEPDSLERILRYAMADQTDTRNVPAPPCIEQPPSSSIGGGGEMTDYLHVFAKP